MSNNDILEFSHKVGTDTNTGMNRPRKSSGMAVSDEDYDLEEEVAMPEGSDRFKTSDSSERRWSSTENKFWGCSSTYDSLPAGLYKPRYSSQIGIFLEKQIVDTDELLVLPDTESENVLKEIETFWTLKDSFKERGFIHKRGILMWGDPGSGKTATIQILIRKIIDQGGIALFVGEPNTAVSALQMVRRIEPDRKIIAVLEDFESLIDVHGDSEYLAMLDGESQVGDVVFVATTNYPEKLDKRFVDRPSRFDTIKKVGMPSDSARRFYLSHKESSLTEEELTKWVKLSKDFSIAHLKEMIIANRCYNKPIEEVVERLQTMRDRSLSSKDALENRISLGFTK